MSFFSIICTVYNGQDFIQECIESVLRQTFTDWELIIVDDGSIDNTAKICASYRSEKIKVYHKDNTGQYDSRLFGIKQSNANYVVFLDSDDLLTSDALSKLHCLILENSVDIISFNYKTFSNSNLPLRKDCLIDKEAFINNYSDILSTYFYEYFLFSLCTCCFKASVLKETYKNIVAKPLGKFGEDAVFLYEVMRNIKSALLVKDVFYYYRMQSNSVSHAKSVELSYHRIFNLNTIYTDLYHRKFLPKNNKEKLFAKISWPIFTYIFSIAVKNVFKTFKIKCKEINKMLIFKKYFKIKGVSGLTTKIIVGLIKLKMYYFAYVIVKIKEKRTHYYEKNNY